MASITRVTDGIRAWADATGRAFVDSTRGIPRPFTGYAPDEFGDAAPQGLTTAGSRPRLLRADAPGLGTARSGCKARGQRGRPDRSRSKN